MTPRHAYAHNWRSRGFRIRTGTTSGAGLARLKLISRWINGDPFMLSVSTNALAIVMTELVNVIYEYLNLVLNRALATAERLDHQRRVTSPGTTL